MTNKQKYDAIVMNAILNYTDDYTKEDYEKSANYTYSKHITMKQFKEYKIYTFKQNTNPN